MRVAIYDLDRTLTPRPTFTPFLIHAARTQARWRLAGLPVWILAMIGYRLGLYSRTSLKRFGMRLMVGPLERGQIDTLGENFARHRIGEWGWVPAVKALLEEDREKGAKLVVATAAFGFYAAGFARALGIDEVVATRWEGGEIPGGNCYGETKRERVMAWMDEQGLNPQDVHIRFVSDSFADEPLLEFADEAIFVTVSRRKAAQARAAGWRVIDPRP